MSKSLDLLNKGTGSASLLRIRGSGSRDGLVVELGPGWAETDPMPFLDRVKETLGASPDNRRLVFQDAGIDRQDALVAAVLVDLLQTARQAGLEFDLESLPDKLRKLVELSLTVKPHEPATSAPDNLITRLGRHAIDTVRDSRRYVEFTGEIFCAAWRFITGRARYRRSDFWVTVQECGASALPIVSLLSVLTGLILGFVGAVQLQKFGATIYMTDLVGLAMAREMGCLMTGVIMSGRTGAAFAAQIGSMKVNQEIDALETLGISPAEFLVLPRMLALLLMMPLLTVYADVLGWFGGFLVAMPMGINPNEYWIQLKESLTVDHISFGVFKSYAFAIVVAASGCYYGLTSGRSSAAVGQATTRAVVAGITWIVVLDAAFAILSEVLD